LDVGAENYRSEQLAYPHGDLNIEPTVGKGAEDVTEGAQ
jgi:hypothetical protein